jgi:long-chain acyl-CoA synthetase
MAATMLGAVIVPMNSWWKGPEIEYGLNDSASKLLFIDSDRLVLLGPHLDNVDVEEPVIIRPTQDAGSNPEFYSLFEGVLPLTSEEIETINVQPESNASIMYTSGSTGMPKGVLSTHRNIINALYTWCFVKEITENLRPELLEENPEFDPAILANVPLYSRNRQPCPVFGVFYLSTKICHDV